VPVKHPSTSSLGKRSIQQEGGSFCLQTELQFKEETSEVLHMEHSFVVVVKTGHFRKWIRNMCKGLKCGAGEGWS
jgi:hypothetical protein